MENKNHLAETLEKRCSELEQQVKYYKAIAEEAGQKRLREVEQLNRQIFERKKAEETQANLEKRLRQSQTIEAIGLMVGGVAHDLNNILSGIIGYPELILKTLPDDSDLRESIVAIKNSGYRAAAVVADLLTLARGVASTREDHDLHSIIKEQLDSPECKELSVLPSKVKLEYHLNAQESYISCSPVHIKKCLMNLIINAAEAVTTSGTINITTSNHSLDRQAAAERNLKVGDYILLKVKDNGPGISEKDLGHIFEPFYTKKKMGKSGTGLGLMVVFNTVEEHGGRISVQSTDDGTCFQMCFPLAVENRAVPRESNTAEAITGQKEHILVIDDDPQMLDLASKMLTTLGYTVDSVCSGEEAVKFVKKQSVDLIVLDMLMEPGMNGYQTYREIAKLYPNQKALIASGFSVSDDVEAAMKLGAGGFIKKPYSIDQFGQAVKEVLNS